MYGNGESQTSETPGTLYYFTTQIRDLLLVAYDGNEEQLSTFGFNVVVSASTSGGRGSEPDPGPGLGPESINVDIETGQSAMLYELVGPDPFISLSVQGEKVIFCASDMPGMACGAANAMILLPGESFEGLLSETGIPFSKYLNATNDGPGKATVSFIP